MSYFKKLRLLFSTLRYLTMEQILSRGKRIVRRRIWKLTGRQVGHPTGWQLAPHLPLYEGLPQGEQFGTDNIMAAVERGRSVPRREFSFLNQPVDLSRREGWHDPDLSHLWRYHLHYFDYVQDLLVWSAAWEGTAAYEAFLDIANSWIIHTEKLSGDGWHHFTISVRLGNWLHALQGFDAP